jgi:hypothetical protein
MAAAIAGDAVRKSLVHASQICNAVEGGVDYRRKNGERGVGKCLHLLETGVSHLCASFQIFLE